MVVIKYPKTGASTQALIDNWRKRDMRGLEALKLHDGTAHLDGRAGLLTAQARLTTHSWTRRSDRGLSRCGVRQEACLSRCVWWTKRAGDWVTRTTRNCSGDF